MSDTRRERLLDIQRKEQLKGMLVNKFKLKYGDRPHFSKYIDNEVTKFLKNDRLTEETLKKLDDKINKETAIREKREDILDDRKSERSRASSHKPKGPSSRRGHDDIETKSVKSVASSRMSGGSKVSKHSQRLGVEGRNFDQMSITSSQAPPKTELYSEIDEEDEWTAIQKFNTLLHYEEQK